MKEQGRKLMSMMTFVVGSLTRLESLVPAVQGLGVAFSKEVEEAWRTANGVLATTMQKSSREAIHATESAAS